MKEPKPEYLTQQLVRLGHALFDVRSAIALAEELVTHHDRLGPTTYGLLTGLAVSYARPFTSSTGGYGEIGKKWSRFPADRPEFKRHHDRLIELRKTMLAHTDDTPHRRIGLATRGALSNGEHGVFEARSPINASGIAEVLEMLRFQEERLVEATDELATRLEELGYVPDGVFLELNASGGFTILDPGEEKFKDTRLEEL